jgi:hypothetical protein
MSKKEKAVGRKARRDRRAKRNAIAVRLTNNLIAKELTPAQVHSLLNQYQRLLPAKGETGGDK